ncbi:MAG: RICIN domain-containing protein [Pseudomonadota bacterium]
MTRIFGAALWVSVLIPLATLAEQPDLRTPAPVIHLTDNLDEPDGLGWCIDTQGRGFGPYLHAHSCKPRGGDVQFELDPGTALIRSVAFPDFCMVYEPNAASPMGLEACDPAASDQAFGYASATGQITLGRDPSLCLSVGAESRPAGPFSSRSLGMEPCDGVPPARKSWTVLP